MGGEGLSIRALFSLPFLIFLASFFTTETRAQTCTLNTPLPTTIVDSAPSTTFLPSGHDGQIVVRRKYAESSGVRVFETSSPEPQSWKVLSEPAVISVKPAPEKTDEGSSPADSSSVIRFIVPTLKNSLWEARTFVIRFCEQGGGDALAITRVPVSSPILAKLISVGVLLLFYVGFSLAVSKIRSQPHPLAVKYPAFARRINYNFLKHLDPVVLTANAFNKSSIQKLQVLFFTLLISGMVLSLVLTLGVLSNLSLTVAFLLGISAVGAAVAQKTTTGRDRLGFDNWAWLVQKNVLPINEEDPVGPRWSELVMTNREFDVYKLQTLIFSIVVALALLAGGEEHLSSFTVPDTLLGILGLSQVVYVAGTLATPPSVQELDQAVTSLREMESRLQTAVERNTDTDAEGKLPVPLPAPPDPLPPLPARKNKAINATRQYSKQADQVEIMIESTLGAEINRSRLEPALS